MNVKETATEYGVREAWDFWLSQHPVSLPAIIKSAIQESLATSTRLESAVEDALHRAVTDWLNVHGADLIRDAIAQQVKPDDETGEE